MRTWAALIDEIQQTPPAGGFLRIPKSDIGSPLDAGAERSIGLFRGQTADFRWTLPDCSGAHAQEFASYYELHIDQISPSCDPIGHLQADAPGAFVLVAAVVCGAASAAVFGLRGALPGGLAGAMLGALMPPVSRAARP